MSALSHQVGGTHYRNMKIQPVEYCLANMLPFCEGNVVKYVSRWESKGGVEDLRKARQFIQFIQEEPQYIALVRRLSGMSLAAASWRDTITPDQYIKANNLPLEEGGVIRHITVWAHTGTAFELTAAMKWMNELLARAQQ